MQADFEGPTLISDKASPPFIFRTVTFTAHDLLVFDAAPQPFDEHVVAPSPFAVHADGNIVAGKQTGERRAGELCPWSVFKISGLP